MPVNVCVVVSYHEGDRHPVQREVTYDWADGFEILANGALLLKQGSKVLASFAPTVWRSVEVVPVPV